MTDQLTRDLVAATTPPPTTFDVDRIARDGRARRRRRATVMTGLAAVTVAAVVTVVALPNQRHAPSTLIDNRTPTASPPQRQYIGPGLPCSSDYELRVNDEQVAYFGVREIAPGAAWFQLHRSSARALTLVMKPSDHPYSIETLAIDVADTHDRKLTKEATADGHQGSLNATQTIPVTTTEGTELPDGRYLLDIGLELNNCDLGGPAGVSTSIPIDLVTP